jgi:hypothetical protein
MQQRQRHFSINYMNDQKHFYDNAFILKKYSGYINLNSLNYGSLLSGIQV